jgi:hypothetical protein
MTMVRLQQYSGNRLTTFRAISRCDAPVADPEPAINCTLAAEMRKVYSSCGISAMLALMISPIGSIPICEVSCEHDSITEVAGDGEILIMLSARLCGFYAA